MRIRAAHRLLAFACAGSLSLASASASAQSASAPSWRDVLRSWCAQGETTECARVAALDPDPDESQREREALIAADHGARDITALLLMAANQPALAQRLRAAPAVDSRAAAAGLLTELFAAYVQLLPPGARPLTRSWGPETFVHDLEATCATHNWQQRVRDANTPTAMLREHITHAATLVQRATSESLTADAAISAAAALGVLAIANGAAREDVIRTIVTAVEAMPAAPPPPDPANEGPPDRPSRRQVMIAMEGVRTQVAHCVGVQDGTVVVRVTFQGSDGHVADATVTGMFANTMVGACTRTAVMSANVPTFDRENVVVNYPFVVFGAHPDRQPPNPTIPPGPAAVRALRAAAAAQPAQPAQVIDTNTAPAPIRANNTVDANANTTSNTNGSTATTNSNANTTASTNANTANVASDIAPAVPPEVGLRVIFEQLEPTIRACAPGMRGAIDIDATINGQGLADHVSANGPRLAVDARDCIEQAVMNANFPHFAGSATVHHRVGAAARRRR